jgi:hypothetical protein
MYESYLLPLCQTLHIANIPVGLSALADPDRLRNWARKKGKFCTIIAGFGKRNVRGVFGTDFGSYVMTIWWQISNCDRKVSYFWQAKTTSDFCRFDFAAATKLPSTLIPTIMKQSCWGLGRQSSRGGRLSCWAGRPGLLTGRRGLWTGGQRHDGVYKGEVLYSKAHLVSDGGKLSYGTRC